MNIDLTSAELDLLLHLIDASQVRGIDSMRRLLALSEKLQHMKENNSNDDSSS